MEKMMIVSDYFGSMDFISELGERKSVSRAIERKNVLKGKEGKQMAGRRGKQMANLYKRRFGDVIYRAWGQWSTSLLNITYWSISRWLRNSCLPNYSVSFPRHLDTLLDLTLHLYLSLHLKALVQRDFLGHLINYYFILLERYNREFYTLWLDTTHTRCIF